MSRVEAEPPLFQHVCLPQVTKDDNIIVSTGYGRGVSNVKVGVATVSRCVKATV